MGQDVELRCRCGRVHGWLNGASPETVHRIICYCDDCQASMHHLGRADLLDAHGGSDTLQVSPAAVRFDAGTEHIAAMQLRKKGMFHWYAKCCNTPLGVTPRRAVPFLPLNPALAVTTERDALFGPPRGALFTRFATGTPSLKPFGQVARFRYLLMIIQHFKTWPNPFFDRRTKKHLYPLATTLSTEALAALRRCADEAGRDKL